MIMDGKYTLIFDAMNDLIKDKYVFGLSARRESPRTTLIRYGVNVIANLDMEYKMAYILAPPTNYADLFAHCELVRDCVEENRLSGWNWRADSNPETALYVNGPNEDING